MASQTPVQTSTQQKTEPYVPLLSRLSPPKGAVRGKRRKGRGPGSGLGTTAGKGQKGQKARTTGSFSKLYFEGGQTPMQRRLPKVGFFNPASKKVCVVNVGDLVRFTANTTVDIEALMASRLVQKKGISVKVLGTGELDRPLVVCAHAFSAAAKDKIEKAGGSVRVIEVPQSKQTDNSTK